MREIKFRVWSGNMWLDGGDALLHVKDKDSTNIELLAGHPLKEYTICRYTGLKDKNGKEIYEGDILLDSDYGQPKRALAVVMYQGAGFVPHKPKPSSVWYEWCPIKDEEGSSWEVIGDIYENPQLLENKEEREGD